MSETYFCPQSKASQFAGLPEDVRKELLTWSESPGTAGDRIRLFHRIASEYYERMITTYKSEVEDLTSVRNEFPDLLERCLYADDKDTSEAAVTRMQAIKKAIGK